MAVNALPPPNTPLLDELKQMSQTWYRYFFQRDLLTVPIPTKSYIEFTEMTAPANGPAKTARLFCQDNGGGKAQLCVIFPTGVVQVIATEP